MKQTIKALLQALASTISICITMTGCTSVNGADDLMRGVKANAVSADVDLRVHSADVTDFGVRLFQNSLGEGKNTLVSPLSVLSALAMTANGAGGDTLAQMEGVLGMPVEELNTCLHTCMAKLPEEAAYKLSLANAIWFTDDEGFRVNEAFLQVNADYYGAGIYKTSFDDSTLREINDWVEDNTDGMIKDILDKIPEEAIMYLVNALAFDAQWQTIYEETQLQDGVFTTENGTKRDMELMRSKERHYLEDEKAAGFFKYYDDGAYAFVALLPKEGVSVTDYVHSLTGQHLHRLLSSPRNETVNAAIPKFAAEYRVEMSDILADMGMPNAFDWTTADFSGIGSLTDDVRIVIDRVLHKTFLRVDEKGTEAGAAAVVEMTAEGAAPEPEDTKTVILNRPFVYVLMDCENALPLFMGTVMDIGA